MRVRVEGGEKGRAKWEILPLTVNCGAVGFREKVGQGLTGSIERADRQCGIKGVATEYPSILLLTAC